MYGIMLVNQAGETIASVGWDHLDGDVSLFGGFVSAVQMFIKRASGGDGINEMIFGDMKLIIESMGSYHIVTLHEADEASAIKANRQVIKIIEENGANPIDDGVLGLIREMVTLKSELSEEMEESVRTWTQSQLGKAKKSASDWGKKVF